MDEQSSEHSVERGLSNYHKKESVVKPKTKG